MRFNCGHWIQFLNRDLVSGHNSCYSHLSVSKRVQGCCYLISHCFVKLWNSSKELFVDKVSVKSFYRTSAPGSNDFEKSEHVAHWTFPSVVFLRLIITCWIFICNPTHSDVLVKDILRKLKLLLLTLFVAELFLTDNETRLILFHLVAEIFQLARGARQINWPRLIA